MKVYLAARYSRRKELCGYRTLLEQSGHVVTSRWLNGDHQVSDNGTPIGEAGEALIEGDDGSSSNCAAELRQTFAKEDFDDVARCDLLIAFTEAPRSGSSRGGRHVELGMALAYGRDVMVVGHRENIFCWLECVEFYSSFAYALEALAARTPVAA